MRTIIDNAIQEHLSTVNSFSKEIKSSIESVGEKIYLSLENGGKTILMGNGGSAADCQHIAAELVGRFVKERRGLAAIALTVDTSIITAIGNDYGFENIFTRQIEALATKNDIVVGISTSGNSENIIRGIEKAKEKGSYTICLLGNSGGKLKDISDTSIIIPSNNTARIQECHILIGHIICELIDSKIS